MSDVQAYPVETIKVILPVSAEIMADQDVMPIVNSLAQNHALSVFTREHPDIEPKGATIRSIEHRTQEFDPQTFAPFEEPRHYYIGKVDVWYSEPESTPIDKQ